MDQFPGGNAQVGDPVIVRDVRYRPLIGKVVEVGVKDDAGAAAEPRMIKVLLKNGEHVYGTPGGTLNDESEHVVVLAPRSEAPVTLLEITSRYPKLVVARVVTDSAERKYRLVDMDGHEVYVEMRQIWQLNFFADAQGKLFLSDRADPFEATRLLCNEVELGAAPEATLLD